jgi:hypothetical protein
MTTDEERDADMDRLLRATLQPSQHASAADCPDAALLAAFGEGSLSEPERLQLESHFALCPRCQDSLAAFARTASVQVVPVPVPRPWLRAGHLRWLIPFAAASVVVLYVASRSVVAPSFLPVTGVSPAASETQAAAVPEQLAVNRAPDLPPAAEASRPAERASGGGTRSQSLPVSIEPRAKPSAAPGAMALDATADRTPAMRPRSELKEAAAPAPIPGRADAERRLAAAAPVAQVPPAALGAGVNAPRTQAAGAAADATQPKGALPASPDQLQANVAMTVTAAPPAAAEGRAVSAVASGEALSEAKAAAAVRKMAFREPELPLIVATPGAATRWRLERGGGISRSADGGVTWQRQVPADSPELLAASSPSSLVCWAVGRSGVVLLTTDGERWQARPIPARVDVMAIGATGPLDASVVTRDGRRFATTDGGLTWTAER